MLIDTDVLIWLLRGRASAVESGATLISANTKHYQVIPDIDLRTYRP